MMDENVFADFTERVRDRARITDLAGELTRLSQGARPVGLCPFHKETDASFVVYPEENRWKCFGCGRGGSVFDFVMQAEGVDFWGAVLQLAGRYGIQIPEFGTKDKQAAGREQAVRAFLAEYVTKSAELLQKKQQVLAYLANRGISEDSIHEYQIGYGAAIRDPKLRKKAIAAGLIRVVDDQEYELQAGRLIFPVMHHGKVVQITGRSVGRGKPKYIGLAAPIVPMGIHRLRGRQCVLVEGAIDRILLEQAGIPACATVSGNFSRDWLRYCGKDTRFVLAYDADANGAGQAASEKIGRLLFEAGHGVDVLELPEGHDPASYVQENGGDAFKSLMAQAVPYVSYWIRRQPEKPPSGELERILRQAYELIARVDPGLRGPFVREISEKYSVTQGDVRSGLMAWLAEHPTSNGEQRALPGMPTPSDVPDDGRPVIYADDDDLPAVTEQMWEAVRGANQPPQFFRQGGVPIRLKVDDNGAMAAQRWTIDIARYELMKIISWRRRKRSKTGQFEIEAIPSDNRWRNFLSVRDAPLPVLSRITEVPVFAPDGTLQTEPGYHPASRTYYQPAPGIEIPALPNKITDEHIEEAMYVFDDITCDFPFKEPADRAHAFALWLLPFIRDLIPGPTPLHLIEGPSPGSGKGLLMDVLVMPSVGPHIGTVTQAKDEDEWRKLLTAVLSKAQPVVMIDNVAKSLDSGTLSSALTQLVWEGRILGRTEMVDVPIRCVWAATANNPTMSTEIARRAIRIRIDPQVDRPWLREEFRHPNLRAYAMEQRTRLIWAALVICRGWIDAGMTPYSGRPLGSFEQWSRIIGGVCESADVEGFLGNLTEFYEIADIEGSLWRAFVEIWWEKHEDEAVGVAQLFETATDSELWNFGKGSERSQRIVFGKMLVKQRDRVIGEYRIIMAGERQRARQWALLPTKKPNSTQLDT